jgi:hypothetical protein
MRSSGASELPSTPAEASAPLWRGPVPPAGVFDQPPRASEEESRSRQAGRLLFIGWAIAVMIVLPLASRTASITEDEPPHMAYGRSILAWYIGSDDSAIRSPFNSAGQWEIWIPGTDGISYAPALNIYGGFFDLVAAAVHAFIFPGADEYQTKHGVDALFGAMVMVFTGLLVREITGSWWAGVSAMVLATLTPRLFGYSLNNPKDIPFAAMFTFTLWQIACLIGELPRVSRRRVLGLSIGISTTIAVRSIGILLIGYVLLFTTLYLLWSLRDTSVSPRQAMRAMTVVVFACVVGYLSCGLFWPWALQDPLWNPALSISVLREFDVIKITELFEGRWISKDEMPWYFAPKWIMITLPLGVVVGFVAAAALLPAFLRMSKVATLSYLLVLFSILFPVALIIYSQSNVYNSARQATFIVPSIIAIAALAWTEMYRRSRLRYQRLLVAVCFIALLIERGLFILRNNPLQGMYFSPLIGGTQGAFKSYEMDYYGFAVQPALDWIEENAEYGEGGRPRVRLWFGDQTKIKHPIERTKKLEYVLAVENSTDWDYFIEMPATARHYPQVLERWPPPGTVHEVTADGAPASAVIKNWRKDVAGSAALVEASAADYAAGRFRECFETASRAAALNPTAARAFNNAGICAANLGLWDEAISNTEHALRLDPNSDLTLNNLAWIQREKAKAQELRLSDLDRERAPANRCRARPCPRRGGRRTPRSPRRYATRSRATPRRPGACPPASASAGTRCPRRSAGPW